MAAETEATVRVLDPQRQACGRLRDESVIRPGGIWVTFTAAAKGCDQQHIGEDGGSADGPAPSAGVRDWSGRDDGVVVHVPRLI